jgi:hypothetical protein
MPSDTTENDEAIELIRTKSDAEFQWLIGRLSPPHLDDASVAIFEALRWR